MGAAGDVSISPGNAPLNAVADGGGIRYHAGWAAAVNVLCGLLVGICIGVVPIVMTYEQTIANCNYWNPSTTPSSSPAPNGVPNSTATNVSSISFVTTMTSTTAMVVPFNDSATMQDLCARVPGGWVQCEWQPAARNGSGECAYASGSVCRNLTSQSACSSDGDCAWDDTNKVCQRVSGWSATTSGIFAGGLILGGFLGSPLPTPILSKCGRRGTFAVLGVMGLLGSSFTALGWAIASFWTLNFGQFIMGVYSIVASVAAPMYCGEMAPVRWRNPLGEAFQAMLTTGIFLGALVGYLMPPDMSDPTTSRQLQWFFLIFWIPSAAFFPLAYFAPEPSQEAIEAAAAPPAVAADDVAPAGEGGGTDGAKQQHINAEGGMNAAYEEDRRLIVGGNDGSGHRLVDASSSRSTAGSPTSATLDDPLMAPTLSTADFWKGLLCHRRNIVLLLCGIMLNVVQQLTGINSVMVYAPSITARVGMAPLVGNMVVTAINNFMSFVSIAVSTRFQPRPMFLLGGTLISISSVLVGLSVYPGIGSPENATDASSTSQHALGMLAITAFIASYAIFIGPPYYVIAQGLFQEPYRSLGCSWTNGSAYLFNLAINVLFPIAVQGISGGPSGNQNLGTAEVYFIFAGFGAAGTIFLLIFLPKAPKAVAH